MIASTSATHVATSTTSRAATEAGTLLLRGPSPLPSPENKLLPVHPNHATPTSELITYSQLPVWLQDNIHIHQHYRKLSNSTLACVSSWTYLHNESVNIFSHLFPAVILLSVIRHLCCEVLPTMYPLATGGDCLVLAIFLAAAVVCFGVSAGFHTFLCHSERVATVWLHMDFLGIVLMIEGCFVSGIYVGFYCEPELRKMYWGMILLLGLLCGIIVSSPKFQGQEWRAFRLGSFIATGLSAIAPIAHGVYLFGFEQMMRQSGVPYYLLEGVLVVLGAWIYNNRLPEALSPGSFDIWGSSHQIFHILVVVAMGVHFVGIAKAYDYNYSHQRCTTVV